MTSPTINKKLKIRHNFYLVNDNDNEMTLKANSNSAGSIVGQGSVHKTDRNTHWYATKAVLKIGQNRFDRGYYVHSSLNDRLVWTRSSNWHTGAKRHNDRRRVYLRPLKKGNIHQIWGYTNTGRWYAYDPYGMDKEKVTADSIYQKAYNEWVPYVFDQAPCGPTEAKLVREGSAKQQMWHIQWIANMTNENIVEIEGWSMDDGDHVVTINNVTNVGQARTLAREYLEKHPLYFGKWDKVNSKYYVYDIVKSNGSGPYKVSKGHWNIYFVGIQFYTRTAERNFPALLKKVGLSLGTNPNRKQITMYANFVWKWKYGSKKSQINHTEAKYLMTECLVKMGRAFNLQLFNTAFKKFDKADGKADNLISVKFFDDMLWAMVYEKPKDVVILHIHQKAIKQNQRKNKRATIGHPLLAEDKQEDTEAAKVESDKLDLATE